MSIKVAFVNPWKQGNEFLSSAAPPYNLMYLASYIKKNFDNFEIKIIDGIVGDNICMSLKAFNPDYVCITSTTPIINIAYELADWARKELDCIVIMGGVHVSVMPQEAIKHCDYVVVGEGEIALVNLIKYMPELGGVIEADFIMNLDEIPQLDFSMIDIEHYINAKYNSARTIPYCKKDARAITIVTSRGCNAKCIFCHNSFRGTPTRYNSAQRVFDIIKDLVNNYKINAIWFGDDEFLINRPRLYMIINAMKENNIHIEWGCQARADTILRYGIEYLKMLKESGCNLIAIGCESGNDRVLKFLKDNQSSIQNNSDAIKLCNQAGIKVAGSFMVGVPGETKEEMMDTFNFIMNHDIIGSIGIATPYPGTTLWKIALSKGFPIDKIDYSRYLNNLRPEDSIIICDTMSKEDFIKLYNMISQKIGEKIMYNKVLKEDVPVSKIFWHSFKKKPWFVISFPIRHPIKTLKMVARR